MKRYLIIILLAAAVVYKVYDIKDPLIPRYIVKERGNGTMAVFEAGKPVLPKYIIRNEKLYKPGQPLVPVVLQRRSHGRQMTDRKMSIWKIGDVID